MNRCASDSLTSVAALDSPGSTMGDRANLYLSLQRESRIKDQPLTDREGMWAGTVRRTAVAKLHYWRLGNLAEDAGLLISELITNALRYGTGETIEFHFELNSDTVLIEVDDGSPGRPYVREIGPEEESGRGMLLVSALATDWGVSPDGTRTWCTLTHTRPDREDR